MNGAEKLYMYIQGEKVLEARAKADILFTPEDDIHFIIHTTWHHAESKARENIKRSACKAYGAKEAGKTG